MLRKFLDRFFLPAAPAAAVPKRIKRYSAQSGYVFEYYLDNTSGGCFQFRLSWNRKDWLAQEMVVSDGAAAAWETQNGRTLRPQERYAAAKLGLFALLDEAEPKDLGRPRHLSAAEVLDLLMPLDL